MMRKALLLISLPAVALFAVRPAVAENRPLDFIHALQKKDLADEAVEYLNMLKAKPPMPAELAEVWDLEMSQSLHAAASQNAFDSKDFDEQMTAAQKYLDKFLQEKPNHPEAVTAMVAWGDFLMERATQHLSAARGATDKTQAALQLKEARTVLEAAAPKYKLAIDKYKQRLASLPPPGLPAKRETRVEKIAREDREKLREDLDEGRINARFQAALVDYRLAQTYDPADKKTESARVAALRSAAEGFDAIFQLNRVNVVGLYAHMWHGKVMEELGDEQTAADIFDEVLASAPDPDPRNPGATVVAPVLAQLFAQVKYFRLLIMAKKSKHDFFEEATAWLETYGGVRSFRSADHYQGIILELAKTQLDAANSGKASSRDAAKLRAEAKIRIGEVAHIHSQFQSEAILLLRKLKNTGGGAADAQTFDEAVALANAAIQTGQWADAVTGYQRALELSAKVRDAALVQDVNNQLAYARSMVANDLFQQGKYEECLAAAAQLTKEFPGTAIGPSASALAVHAALALYQVALQTGAAPEKREAALERLVKIANYTISTWPKKPEADDARMALGQASLVIGKADEALAVFEQVNRKSDRYPVALYLSAQTYWRRYLIGTRRGGADKQQLAADRIKARELLRESLDIQRRTIERGKPWPQQLIDTQLLLAEIALDAGEPKEAVSLFAPLVATIKAARPESLDPPTLRIFRGAVLGYAALGDMQRASDVSALLLELGPDQTSVNSALVEFAKLVNEERKKAEAAVSAAPAGDQNAIDACKARLKVIQDMLGNLAKKLAQRKQMTPYGVVFVADTCGMLEMDAEAKQLYQGFLERLDKDADFARTGIKAKTRVLSQLVGLLRKEGSFQEADQQVKELVRTNPHALEPRMEQGRILQAWAEQEPAKYADAANVWTKLRNVLQSMPKKPPEFYEVTYDLALCLAAQGMNEKDAAQMKAKLTESEQVLKSTLVLSPQLNGPDMVAKYNALLTELANKLHH
jgi:tetratricopeptide (TPR) repeat protein